MNDETNRDEELAEMAEVGGGPATGEADALRVELEEVRAQALYAQAETQNVRRRLEKEKVDAAAYATTGFARDMLSVSDNLSRALAAIPAELRTDDKMKPLITGIEMTAKELESIFQRQGITRIESMGQPLDPNRHQAIMEMEHQGAAPGTIVHEMQTGWMIRDRLLRPAMVGVAKAAPEVRVDATA